MQQSKLFEPVALGGKTTLRNRVAMAPMTTWAGNADGTISDAEDAYYRRRVAGVGLVISGCTHVQANGVGFTDEFAAYDDSFIPSLTRLATAAKSGGAPAVLQIFHAGVKAMPDLASEIVAASAVPGDAGPFAAAVTPRALTDEEILDVISAFGDATRRAIAAGFDGVELHGAHGFLIQNFLSPYFNRRGDCWGGSLDNRMRFPLAVVAEVRKAIAVHADRPFLLGYRISPEEPNDGGLRMAESLVAVDRLIEAGIDYLHASLANISDSRPIDDDGGETIARLLAQRVAGRVPLIAAGQVRTPDDAERALADGVDVVAIGQGLVMNPDWIDLVRNARQAELVHALGRADVAPLAIPQKLWNVIEAMPGWFAVRETA